MDEQFTSSFENQELTDLNKNQTTQPIESAESKIESAEHENESAESKTESVPQVILPVQQAVKINSQPSHTVNKIPAKTPVSGKAVASLVLGILGLICVFTVLLSPVSVVMGIVGLVLGIVSVKKQRSGLGIAGIILSSLSLGIGLLEVVSCAACVGIMTEGFNQLENIDNFGPFHNYMEDIQELQTI